MIISGWTRWYWQWWVDRKIHRLFWLLDQEKELTNLLDDIQPGNDDTEPFRAHLARRIVDIQKERESINEGLARHA